MGRTSIGVYFSADWCPSCTKFTPLLTQYYQNWMAGQLINNKGSNFLIILVSRCKTSRDTNNFFDPMPWAAIPHRESTGGRGTSLMARFRIRTIPALVLLDANGAVTSSDGCGLITSALAKHSLAASDGLLPAPQLGTPGARQPGGDPPSFPPGLLAFPAASERLTRGRMTRAP
jgi:hypothetical protein